jgi:hypothetical protein
MIQYTVFVRKDLFHSSGLSNFICDITSYQLVITHKMFDTNQSSKLGRVLVQD